MRDSNPKRTPAKHPHHALTSAIVQRTRAPGRYADGNGLYLVIDPSGAKRWILRTVIHGRRTDLGLGSVRLVSLKEAREEALKLRKVARAGGDPLADRRARAAVPTFEEAARKVHGERAEGWRNPKHAAQWLGTLEAYAFPMFGAKRVDQVGTPDVREALSPIWLKKPETARRVRQRIGVVLDWAKTKGHRDGENPIRSVTDGLPKHKQDTEHHAALPFDAIADFLAKLRAHTATAEAVRLAFEFAILTAARTSEVLLATWDEMRGDTWVIPKARMKAGREHRVPLAPRALEIVKRARELADGGAYIFPGRSKDKPLSNMAFLMALRRMGVDTTAHGFRSSFRDWAAERTAFPAEVCEMALAHTIRDETEAAYRRGDLFDKRRELMGAWAAFTTARKGDVIQLRGRARKRAKRA